MKAKYSNTSDPRYYIYLRDSHGGKLGTIPRINVRCFAILESGTSIHHSPEVKRVIVFNLLWVSGQNCLAISFFPSQFHTGLQIFKTVHQKNYEQGQHVRAKLSKSLEKEKWPRLVQSDFKWARVFISFPTVHRYRKDYAFPPRVTKVHRFSEIWLQILKFWLVNGLARRWYAWTLGSKVRVNIYLWK